MLWEDFSAHARSSELPSLYRPPSQARGEAKFERLLDATQAMIEERGIDEFSLADVAKRADVATGSAYHFFPSLEAAFVALVERFDRAFAEIVRQPIAKEDATSWQAILAIHFENSREYINANPAALTLIIGPGRSWQSKQADTLGDSQIASAMAESYTQHFVLPEHPPTNELLLLGIRILEGFWELSVQQHGYVTQAFSEETIKAATAYLRLYWPEYLPAVEQAELS